MRNAVLVSVLLSCAFACGSSDSSAPLVDAPVAPPPPPVTTATPPTTPPATPPPIGDGGSDADAGVTSKYDADGSVTYSTSTATVTGGAHGSFDVTLYVPNSAGAHPVVDLSPGLQQPASAYAPYGKRLASWGFVVVMRDDPGAFTSTPTVVDDISYVVATWLPAENAKASGALSGKLDLAKVGLAGHSRGGKSSLLAAENGAKGKVKGWFGLDPVDTSPTSGEPHARDTIATVGVPIAMLGAEVTTTCSPAADNYAAFYAAAVSPAVVVEALGANHVQVEDPATCSLCSFCSPAGTADTNVVLAYSVRYLTAFFARELLGDTTVGAAFAGAGAAADTAAGRVTITSK